MLQCKRLTFVVPHSPPKFKLNRTTKGSAQDMRNSGQCRVECEMAAFIAGLVYKDGVSLSYLCEPQTGAAPMPVTRFHYGNAAEKRATGRKTH